MPYSLNVDQEDIDNYLKKGLLDTDLVAKVRILETKIAFDIQAENKQEFSTKNHELVYNGVLEDLAKIQKALDEVDGSLRTMSPKEDVTATGSNGYQFTYTEWLGRYWIVLKHPRITNMEWTIGIKYETNPDPKANEKIIGFYLNSSAFTVKLFMEALENTQQYFPTDHLPFSIERRKLVTEKSTELFGHTAGILLAYLGYINSSIEKQEPAKEKDPVDLLFDDAEYEKYIAAQAQAIKKIQSGVKND